jgi:ATP/ADP translocase/HEAT repeat protein
LTPSERDTKVAVIATLTATAMIGYQMAAKATRDALFLSSFDVSALPAMVIASALLSVVLAFLASHVMTAVGPAFAASAALLLIEWWLLEPFRRPVAVIVYLHYGGLGALLVSGFWSIVNERFDPRTAKKHVGRIAAGATVGGLLGGLLAERVAATLSMAAMLPILASLHFLCALLVMGLKPSSATAAGSSRTPASNPTEKKERRSGLRIIAETSYLRSLVALVLLASVSEVLIDYVFKARASAAFGSGEDLLRLFGVFYTGVALLTVAIQTTASRLTLQKLGLARTVAILPSTLAVGSAGALFAPGLVSAAIARGAEAVMRNSLYRPAYELLFTPIGQRQKRATKTLVDVGVVRLGDMTGGALVQATLLVAAGSALAALLGFAIALAVVAGLVAIRLHRGYVRTLERSLVSRAAQLDLAEIEDVTTRTAMLQTVGTLGLAPISDESLMAPAAEAGPPSGAVMEAHPEPHLDPEVRRIVELRSGDPDGVRRALAGRPLTPTLVPHATPLLAWDQVAPQAIQALRDVAPIVTGQLVDRLLDRDEEFAVRRRIPLVLAACPTERAVEGLLRGLEDQRFEVRYRCGLALSRLLELNPKLRANPERAAAAVLREVAVDRRVWESHRLLDQMEDEEWSPVVDEVLRDRASRSLEHVFTVLALFLPRQPLKIAFRGLHTDDTLLRGTALEYLETALPADIREQLWPFLEDSRPKTRQTRPSGEVLAQLLQSNNSIAINLDELRRKSQS